jgi:hypothetical protein
MSFPHWMNPMAILLLLAALMPGENKPIPSKPAYRVLGNDRGKVAILDSDGKVVWEHKSGFDGHDVSLLPNGNVLLATGAARIAEVNRDKKIVWQYESKPKKATRGALRSMPSSGSTRAEP